MILCANILLRELALGINRQTIVSAAEAIQHYKVQIICLAQDEVQVRSLMLHTLGGSGLRLQSLHSEDMDPPHRMEVNAEVIGNPTLTDQLESLVSRISLEKGVSSVRWQVSELERD